MPSVQAVIDKVVESVGHIENTVDTLKSGDSMTEVMGIATTFVATYNVLQQAIAKGLNLVITHEAPFYNHLDKVNILENDPVYLAKQALVKESGIAIFRLHDYIHRDHPDGIVEGLVRDLEWTEYVDGSTTNAVSRSLETYPLTIPTMSLREVAEYVKTKLNIPFVRIVGNLSMPCSRVGLLPGYCGGGALAIPFFQSENLDLIITGEGPEWETPEYVRDAVALGRNKALIVIGHSSSEESGMKFLAERMKSMFPALPIEFIPEEQPFQVI